MDPDGAKSFRGTFAPKGPRLEQGVRKSLAPNPSLLFPSTAEPPGTPQAPCCQELTSSFVVWLELIRYVWKPESPTIDQTEKKHTTASSTVTWSQGGQQGGRESSVSPRSWEGMRFGQATPTGSPSSLRQLSRPLPSQGEAFKAGASPLSLCPAPTPAQSTASGLPECRLFTFPWVCSWDVVPLTPCPPAITFSPRLTVQ